jgi:hypothetical protein
MVIALSEAAQLPSKAVCLQRGDDRPQGLGSTHRDGHTPAYLEENLPESENKSVKAN